MHVFMRSDKDWINCSARIYLPFLLSFSLSLPERSSLADSGTYSVWEESRAYIVVVVLSPNNCHISFMILTYICIWLYIYMLIVFRFISFGNPNGAFNNGMVKCPKGLIPYSNCFLFLYFGKYRKGLYFSNAWLALTIKGIHPKVGYSFYSFNCQVPGGTLQLNDCLF
jgi:hypothetical protein